MPTSYTTLLGLALPVTGELSGTWGDTVNDYITQYLDAAVAGAQTISGSQTAVTLSKTTATALTQAGSGATGSSQYQIINCTGNPASALTVTVPSASKVYLVLNNTSTSQTVTVKGAATTGVTVAAARAALIAWNGTDFELVATDDISKMSGVLAAANGGTGQSSYAVGDILYASGTTTLSKLADVATGNALISGGVGVAPSYGKIGLTTHVSGTLPVANGGTGLTSGTSGGVLYYSATGTLASSGALAANSLVIGGGAGVAPSTIATGTGVVTALGVNTGTAGAFVVNGGALGTPSSGTVTNLTGTASININGTVGATTPNTGAFTSVTSTSASGILTRAAATQDGMELIGRAGGTGSFKVTQTPTTLSANRTVTWPNADVNFTTGLGVAQGGTGLTSTPSNGQIDIGNGTGFTRATLTQGSGISITNGAGSITIAATGGGGTVTSVSGTGTVNGITLTGTVTTTGSLTLGGTLSGVSLTSQVSGTLPTGNGGTGLTTFTAANNAIYSTSSSALTAGTLPVAAGGTGATTLAGANIAVFNASNTFTAAQTFRAANAIRSEAASTQDAIVIAGRAGGTSSYAVTLTPATLSASRTVTIPDETFTVGFRNLPAVGTKTGSYTLAVADVGKYVQVGSGGSITIPNSTFSEGDAITIFNNTTGNITITCSITTAYIAGTDTDKATMTLATRGVATILFISGTVCVVSGNVS